MAEKKYDIFSPFQRTKSFPLDISTIFYSYGDALKYAQGLGDDEKKLGKTSYLGQIISVVNTAVTPNTVDVYKIDLNKDTGIRQLSEIGTGGGGGGGEGKVKDIKINSTSILDAAGYAQFNTSDGIKSKLENNFITLSVEKIINPEFIYNNGNFE